MCFSWTIHTDSQLNYKGGSPTRPQLKETSTTEQNVNELICCTEFVDQLNGDIIEPIGGVHARGVDQAYCQVQANSLARSFLLVPKM